MLQPIIISLIVIIIIILSIYINRQHFYFQYSPFGIYFDTFAQRNSLEVSYFDSIEYWKIKRKSESEVNLTNKKVIIFINGNAGNITFRQDIFQKIIDNCDATLYSLNYLSMKNLNIDSIVNLHCKFISDKINHNEFDVNDVIIFGESIGNAIGLEVVKQMSITKFVFYAGFTSISDVICNIIGIKNPTIKNSLRIIIPEFNNYSIIKNKIKNINFKMVMLHPIDDELIPIESVQLMAEKFNIKLIKLEGGHNDGNIKSEHLNFIINILYI